ncbi:MAG: hypothetical protein JWR61_2533 [Ferruginibacter sp.]|uniref:hypothetical protein n=1 Tax=Ferruginibacter sp. TaxID=1940288 RepID=UPI00265851A0|nr:hypothetical protein [Ferruginibacter sp.]MDB5277578.1 hypothetical protein [Ferruginibacter sp.]
MMKRALLQALILSGARRAVRSTPQRHSYHLPITGMFTALCGVPLPSLAQPNRSVSGFSLYLYRTDKRNVFRAAAVLAIIFKCAPNYGMVYEISMIFLS